MRRSRAVVAVCVLTAFVAGFAVQARAQSGQFDETGRCTTAPSVS